MCSGKSSKIPCLVKFCLVFLFLYCLHANKQYFPAAIYSEIGIIVRQTIILLSRNCFLSSCAARLETAQQPTTSFIERDFQHELKSKIFWNF